MGDMKGVMNKKNLLLLLLLIILHFISSYRILEESRIARFFDEFARLHDSFEFLTMPVHEFIHNAFTLTSQLHPRFFSAFEALIWSVISRVGLFHNESIIILVPNMFYLMVLLYAVYGITKILYDDEELSLVSAVLISFIPIIYSTIRVCMLDFPLLCMVALSIYVLLRTDHFQSRTYSIFAGIICGISQLVKETFFVFVFAAVVFYFISSLRQRREETGKILINFFVFLVLWGSLTWYAYHPYIGECLHRYTYLTMAYMKNRQLWYYAYAFFFIYFHPLLLLLFLALIVIFTGKPDFTGRDGLLLAWCIPPFVLFSLALNKDVRFLFPLITPVVIAGVGALKNSGKWKNHCSLALIAISCFQWLVLTGNPQLFNYYSSVKYYQDKLPNAGFTWQSGVPVIKDEIGEYEGIADDIIAFTKSQSDHVVICSFITTPFLTDVIRTKILFRRADIHFFIPYFWGDDECVAKEYRARNEREIEYFKSADYVVYADNDDGRWLPGEAKKHSDELKKQFEKNISGWHLVRVYSAEGKIIYLYKRP
jgi:4-amino-4-deoxy-L-arabinose transferase-like glycosyltransferase